MSTEPSLESPEFDHLLHCVPDVEAAARAYSETGLPAHANPEHQGYRNGAWRLDTRYVELSSVVDRPAFLASPYGRAMRGWQPRYDELVARGGGALNFCVHVQDVGATTRRLRARGHDVELLTFAREGSPVSFREAILKGRRRGRRSSSPTRPTAGRSWPSTARAGSIGEPTTWPVSR